MPRCGTSANAFAFGLLEGTGDVGLSRYQPFFVNSTTIDHDVLLRFFKTCPKYSKWYKEEKNREKEPGSQMSKIIQRVAKNMRRRLRIPRLTNQQVKTLWSLCAFDFAVYGYKHFCSLFSGMFLCFLFYIELQIKNFE